MFRHFLVHFRSGVYVQPSKSYIISYVALGQNCLETLFYCKGLEQKIRQLCLWKVAVVKEARQRYEVLYARSCVMNLSIRKISIYNGELPGKTFQHNNVDSKTTMLMFREIIRDIKPPKYQHKSFLEYNVNSKWNRELLVASGT